MVLNHAKLKLWKIRIYRYYYYTSRALAVMLIFGVFFTMLYKGLIYLASDKFVVNESQIEYVLEGENPDRFLAHERETRRWVQTFLKKYEKMYIWKISYFRQEASKIPFVKTIEIDKVYPDRLKITYSLREPLMITEFKQKNNKNDYLMDMDGHVILLLSQSAEKNYPRCILGVAYSYENEGWKNISEIGKCLDFLYALKKNSEWEDLYWKIKSIQFDRSDRFRIITRAGHTFQIVTSNTAKAIEILDHISRDPDANNGKTFSPE